VFGKAKTAHSTEWCALACCVSWSSSNFGSLLPAPTSGTDCLVDGCNNAEIYQREAIPLAAMLL